MPNATNIQKMIDAISAEKAPIYMGNFVSVNSGCGTTACLAGWANTLQFDVKGKGTLYPSVGVEFSDTNSAAAWMGIDDDLAHDIFFNFAADDLSHDNRKIVAIKLLESLRDTGEGSWHQAFLDAGLEYND